MDTTETLRRHLPALAEHLPSGIIIWAEKPYFSLFVTSLDSPSTGQGKNNQPQKTENTGRKAFFPQCGKHFTESISFRRFPIHSG